MEQHPSTPTLEELKQRHARVLRCSEAAVQARPEAYRQLKRRIRTITTTTVDVDAYYRQAKTLAELLEMLSRPGKGSIFDPFLQRIDPDRDGCARYLRMDCRELQAHLADLDLWRADRRRIRCVK